jgi:CYTH domain-containing protein
LGLLHNGVGFNPAIRRCSSLALEIERRFLVAGDQWRRHSRWQQRLRQGYLVAAADGLTLRVRISQPLAEGHQPLAGSQPIPAAHLTIKAAPPEGSAGAALTRVEFEYPIPLADAETLLKLSSAWLIKRRYGLELPGGDWVLDVFEGDNSPLVVAEVELASADQPLQLPSWCVKELTGHHGLSNAALARHPLARWSPEQRQALLMPSNPENPDASGP